MSPITELEAGPIPAREETVVSITRPRVDLSHTALAPRLGHMLRTVQGYERTVVPACGTRCERTRPTPPVPGSRSARPPAPFPQETTVPSRRERVSTRAVNPLVWRIRCHKCSSNRCGLFNEDFLSSRRVTISWTSPRRGAISKSTTSEPSTGEAVASYQRLTAPEPTPPCPASPHWRKGPVVPTGAICGLRELAIGRGAAPFRFDAPGIRAEAPPPRHRRLG